MAKTQSHPASLSTCVVRARARHSLFPLPRAAPPSRPAPTLWPRPPLSVSGAGRVALTASTDARARSLPATHKEPCPRLPPLLLTHPALSARKCGKRRSSGARAGTVHRQRRGRRADSCAGRLSGRSRSQRRRAGYCPGKRALATGAPAPPKILPSFAQLCCYDAAPPLLLQGPYLPPPRSPRPRPPHRPPRPAPAPPPRPPLPRPSQTPRRGAVPRRRPRRRPSPRPPPSVSCEPEGLRRPRSTPLLHRRTVTFTQPIPSHPAPPRYPPSQPLPPLRRPSLRPCHRPRPPRRRRPRPPAPPAWPRP
jgi:hypothetical protein